ncbi:MAG: hypothetical protein ACRD3E_09135 [Terriglobales bacterium]
MRKLSLIAAVVCLVTATLCAQSRHRGYNANGGWHKKASVRVPARRDTRKEKQAKKVAKTAPVVPPTQKY